MGGAYNVRRNFSGLTLEEAMRMVVAENFIRWDLDVALRPESEILRANLRRLESFELSGSEAAKVLLIDTLLAEIVPDYPNLKIWKSAPLESDELVGVADYLIAPRRAYLSTPFLCAVEAKRDDFDAGKVQCVAEMSVCQWNNRRRNILTDVFGIVSNGQGWIFYKLTEAGAVYESGLFTIEALPTLLGVIDHVIAECAKNVP